MKTFLMPILVVGLLWGCSKDDPPPTPQPIPTTIGKSFVNGELFISNIWGMPTGVEFNRVEAKITGYEWGVIDVVEAGAEDGKVVLTLPAAIDGEDLMKAGRSDAWDYMGCWPAAVDDPAAAVAALGDIYAYDRDTKVGRIYLSDWKGSGSKSGKSVIYFYYADREFSLSGYDFTIVSGGQKSFKYEASFGERWNACANVKSNDQMTLCTTSIAEDKELYWLFESYAY